MMSPRRWILLLIFYISYLMFGASIYYHIEHNLEKERRAEQLQERIQINEYLVDQLDNKNETDQNIVLEKITAYCGKPVTNYTTDQYEEPYTWTFYHAFFFSFTVLSTVGYGNLAPTTTLGRMIMIVYSLIGIPINGILFSGLGDYFSKTFTSIYSRYKKYKMSNDVRYVPPQLSLLATVCITLVPGITFFIVLPSLIFSYFESWSFLTSFYYSYVTMTTIGFGDFVPTFQPQQPREFGGLFVVYQIFIIIWFIFSMGYLIMIMTFISKGLRSKRLARLEYQLSENIKATQSRIWNGVTKDVGYLRRILNELYIMKFKPVYNEPLYYSYNRSISCPDLTMYRVDPPVISRKRAFSECFDAMDAHFVGTPPFRTSSDTELSNIDKQRTFETAETFRQTTDLLAQVVTALANIRPLEEEVALGSTGMHGGYHGFTDSQILASENSYSGMDAIPHRERAFSDFNLNPRTSVRPSANEWTWSGDNVQIQQAINTRTRNRQARDDYYRSAFPSPLEGVVVDVEPEDTVAGKQRRKFSMPDGGKQFFKKLIPFKKRSSQGLIEKGAGVSDRKFSIVSVPEVPDRPNAPHDYYSTINVGHLDEKQPLPGSIQNMFVNGGPSAAALANRRSTMFDAASRQEFYNRNALPIFPPPNAGLRRRRESLFTQNPNMRRGSMFPGGPSSYRRGSLFTDTAPRSVNRGPTSRRPSMLSVTDENANHEILENTTIADIIRALEAVHTQAVLQQPIEENINDRKKRKLGTAGLAPPSLPPIFTIFNADDQPSTSGNRLYSRRSTIVGATSIPPQTASILTRRRPSIVPMDHNDPPPIYTEKEPPKFRRRFSVRPTDLQIPPGMAPPPQGIPSNLLSLPSTSSSAGNSQNTLQRRLSLRPSPLARETIDGTAVRGSGRMAAPPNSSSTHSPLSRIVQISQAQRKNSEQKEPK